MYCVLPPPLYLFLFFLSREGELFGLLFGECFGDEFAELGPEFDGTGTTTGVDVPECLLLSKITSTLDESNLLFVALVSSSLRARISSTQESLSSTEVQPTTIEFFAAITWNAFLKSV